jgi:ABC-type nitrate/sulfonate/bicarbonate transport system ATPase subunit
VLEGLDLVVERGLVYAIVGATGCGKTTLLHLMAGLLTAEKGMVARGEDRLRVALIPQDYGLFPWKNVRDNALMGMEIRSGRRAKPAERARATAILDELGIGDLADRWPATLSGGQKQRTAIARALAPDPALLLMDEPFSALDADIREDLQDLVRSLPVRHGTTPVLVTHDISEALRVADRIILFRAVRGGPGEDVSPVSTASPVPAAPRFVVDTFPNEADRRDEFAALLRDALRSSREKEGGRDA